MAGAEDIQSGVLMVRDITSNNLDITRISSRVASCSEGNCHLLTATKGQKVKQSKWPWYLSQGWPAGGWCAIGWSGQFGDHDRWRWGGMQSWGQFPEIAEQPLTRTGSHRVSKCISIFSPRIDIFTMGQHIWFGTQPSCTVVNQVVEYRKVFWPTDLAKSELLGGHEVLQVLVIGQHKYNVCWPFQGVAPLLEGLEDG